MRKLRFTRWLLAAGIPAAAVACYVVASPPPVGKGLIETPTKSVVANSAPAKPAATAAADNPTVAAGLVKWHKTLEDAQAAAKKSGKPVLLFQMMGYLDKQFC